MTVLPDAGLESFLVAVFDVLPGLGNMPIEAEGSAQVKAMEVGEIVGERPRRVLNVMDTNGTEGQQRALITLSEGGRLGGRGRGRNDLGGWNRKEAPAAAYAKVRGGGGVLQVQLYKMRCGLFRPWRSVPNRMAR